MNDFLVFMFCLGNGKDGVLIYLLLLERLWEGQVWKVGGVGHEFSLGDC